MVSRRQQGFSLIELMIAMVLGLMIVAAVLQTFLAGKRSYEMQADLSRIQENGRFAIEFLKKDIRAADYWGCNTGLSGNITNNLNSGGTLPFDVTKGIYGIDGGLGVSYSVASNTDPIVYSDYLQMAGVYGSGIKVVPTYMNSHAANIKVEDDAGLKKGEVVMVGDCSSGDIFQITNDPTTGGGNKDLLVHNSGGTVSPGNVTGSLSKKYQGDARILRASTTSYEIKMNINGEPALYRNHNEELVEGVESMQVLYGVASGGKMSYQTADSVSDMQDVVTVQVSLLLRGFGNVTDNPMEVEFDDGDTSTASSLTAQDRRLRKVFTSTVALRNRLQ